MLLYLYNVNVQMSDNQIVYRVEDPYVILRVRIPYCRIVRGRGKRRERQLEPSPALYLSYNRERVL